MTVAFGYVVLAVGAALVTIWLVTGVRAESRDRRALHLLARSRS